ncbi:MAG: DoxX family protein [Bacteroidetes bacterium]|nr:DoxX family protein [Bacteroidota bacterium]
MKNISLENSKINDLLLLLLRVSLSLLLMTHGYPKLLKLFSGNEIEFYNFLNLGPKITILFPIIGEFVAPLFIILGYKTRLAACISALTMLCISFIFHFNDSLADKEHSLIFAIGFIYIFITGAGKYSISQIFDKK